MNNQFDPKKHNRRSIRLKNYDYSQAGFYFVTICIQHHKCLLGKIVNEEMLLNEAGKMVEKEWLKLPERFPNIQLHEHVVMPNHFHGIIEILDTWKTFNGHYAIAKFCLLKNYKKLKEKGNHKMKGNHKGLPLLENDWEI